MDATDPADVLWAVSTRFDTKRGLLTDDGRFGLDVTVRLMEKDRFLRRRFLSNEK